ncbi:hypothetical protein [Streptomyces sp. AK02-01A]|uniref:hypothetical protein n=1 Tax=Streptomyces sp. AK02-01A TaxID=3028648 RepID=UPI0029A282A6|nr:hypothetical protein [Streptomyces sp. AK02-01A]MDX3854833.1 hypothetical protein [Streptomyces sp. AK02-01A]
MPATGHSGTRRSPAAQGGAAGLRLERVIPFAFTAADRGSESNDQRAYRDHVESIYGPLGDFSWLEDGVAVSYHDMVRVIHRELAAELAGIDLIITVDASPDCRHQSFPASLLSDLVPGDPLLMGISEQGVAGPFTALRIAVDRLASGSSHRALVLVMEQSTLPPDDKAVRPARDVAVALLLGPRGTMPLDRPLITATGRGGAAAPSDAARPAAGSGPAEREARVLVAGAGLGDLVPGPDVRLTRAAEGHPCAGVWLALAALLERGDAPGGQILIADRDPVLPYLCSVRITLPAEPSMAAHAQSRQKEGAE